VNKYNKRLTGERPLSTLSKEEYDMLEEMGLLWELYPELVKPNEEIKEGEFKKKKD
jgi:hypothetical protein